MPEQYCCGLSVCLGRCLVWEGDWRVDLLMASLKQAESGSPIKLLLTVKEQVRALPILLSDAWGPTRLSISEFILI